MLNVYISFIFLDLLFLAGFFWIAKQSETNVILGVLGWAGMGFWLFNLVSDFVKILSM